jgi:hypothetical protein
MRTPIRLLLLGAILATALGWVGLRRGNDALERRLAAQPAAAGERAP